MNTRHPDTVPPFCGLESPLSLCMGCGLRVPRSHRKGPNCDGARVYYELAAAQTVASLRVASGRWPGLLVAPNADASIVRLAELQVFLTDTAAVHAKHLRS